MKIYLAKIIKKLNKKTNIILISNLHTLKILIYQKKKIYNLMRVIYFKIFYNNINKTLENKIFKKFKINLVAF